MSKLETKIDLLERSLLELGAELFKVKQSILEAREDNHKMIEVLKGLRLILDDRGLISLDDFDAAVELGDALSEDGKLYKSVEDALNKLKKSSH